MSTPRDPQLTALARISRQLEDLDLPALDYLAAKLAEVRKRKAE